MAELKPNPYLKDAFMGRRTAIVPDAKGQMGEDNPQKIAVMLLGVKSNHPLGIFAPRFIKMGVWLQRMTDEFNSQEPPNGFLGQTNYERKDERGSREFTFISYWRSIEDLHEFAHSPLHRQAWIWWESTLKQYNYVGINHEMYEADAGHWENLYVNFQPTGIGATSVLRRGDKLEGGTVGDEWITPLVDARRGKLAKSSGRLGRRPIKYDADRPFGDAYA